jgi:DNA-binding transcriptional regulator YiaG
MAIHVRSKAVGKKQRRAKAKRSPRLGTIAPMTVKPGTALQLRQQLQLSQPVFARLLPTSVRTLATLESGAEPTAPVARKVTELVRLTNALKEVLKEAALGKWLQTPNQAFDGLKPLEVIERGECDRLWSMIYFLRSGVPA